MLSILIGSVLAYLVGSLSSSILVCRWAGLPDPRSLGSGNPGASNILRIAGKRLAGIVLCCDLLKSWLPVMCAKYLGLPLTALAWMVFLGFLGHLFPIFFNFRGGKGVATALGGIFALAWPVGVLTVVVWLLVLALFRYISLASILSSTVGCITMLCYFPSTTCLPMILMTLLLIGRHHANLRRLCRGTEPTLKLKRQDAR